MEILELAKELGKMIKEDDRAKKVDETKKIYAKDSALQQAVFEYNVQRSVLEQECEKETPDEEFLTSVNKRIKELYDTITTNPNYLAYEEAENALRMLMEEIDTVINNEILGETACTGSCSSCSGCGHDHHHHEH